MEYFKPQPAEIVLRLDTQIRAKLADSIAHVLERGLGGPDAFPEFASAATAIRSHRQQPGVFARYFDFVFAAREQRNDDARALLGEICAMSNATPALEIHPLTDAAMGKDAARFARLLDASKSGPIFGPPAAADWRDFDARVITALDALDAIDAELSAEVRALIVMVIGSMPRQGKRSFGSASSLTLWGATVMNLDRHATVLDVIDGLVHESAHQLLFGFALDEPLLANAPKERYASPLRSDPRPMDGVFHATFVCARLHLLYTRLLDRKPKALAAVDDGLIAERRARQKRSYDDGAATVTAQGKPNRIGAEIMQSMSSYMSQSEAQFDPDRGVTTSGELRHASN